MSPSDVHRKTMYIGMGCQGQGFSRGCFGLGLEMTNKNAAPQVIWKRRMTFLF
jgi:hypothetical protein